MTNTYILPEYCEATSSRIIKPFTLKAIIRSFYNTNFHCKRIACNIAFINTGEGQSSSGNEPVISLYTP